MGLGDGMAIHALYCSTAFRIKNPRNNTHRRFHPLIGGQRLPHTFFLLPFVAHSKKVGPLERPFCHTAIVHRFLEIGPRFTWHGGRKPELDFPIWDVRGWPCIFVWCVAPAPCHPQSKIQTARVRSLDLGLWVLDFVHALDFAKDYCYYPPARVGGSYFKLAITIITYYSVLMSWTLKSSCFSFIEDQCELLQTILGSWLVQGGPETVFRESSQKKNTTRDKKVSRCMVAQVVCAGCLVRKGAHVKLG